MLVYRVFPYLPSAPAGAPGHPLYEHLPQLAGRVDHPDYYTWYLGRQPECAAGESFGNLAMWSDSMFDVPFLPAGRRALGVYRLRDDLRVCDLDDPHVLAGLGLRPTQVIVRNLAVTQAWGHAVWSERDSHNTAARRWDAVQWWSYHHPSWDVLASWERPELVRVEDLDLAHDAVVEAGRELRRLTV